MEVRAEDKYGDLRLSLKVLAANGSHRDLSSSRNLLGISAKYWCNTLSPMPCHRHFWVLSPNPRVSHESRGSILSFHQDFQTLQLKLVSRLPSSLFSYQVMSISIRPVTKEDEAALSKICLETSEAGKSGKDVHNYPSLPGEIYALPYVNVPNCVWGFVLVEKPTETSPPSDESVVGYTLGALDSRAFEAATAQTWWPPLKAKYAEGSLVAPQPTETDQRYIKSITNFPPASDAQIAFSPAHLHIDILESHQRKGWGQKLIGVAITHLKAKGLKAVWLGVDTRNKAAALFYERLGFRTFDGAPEGVLGITVEEWENK